MSTEEFISHSVDHCYADEGASEVTMAKMQEMLQTMRENEEKSPCIDYGQIVEQSKSSIKNLKLKYEGRPRPYVHPFAKFR